MKNLYFLCGRNGLPYLCAPCRVLKGRHLKESNSIVKTDEDIHGRIFFYIVYYFCEIQCGCGGKFRSSLIDQLIVVAHIFI